MARITAWADDYATAAIDPSNEEASRILRAVCAELGIPFTTFDD